MAKVDLPLSVDFEELNTALVNAGDERGLMLFQKASHAVEMLQENFLHLRSGQIAARKRENAQICGENCVAFDLVAANGLVLCQNDPTAASHLRQPLDIGSVVSEMISMDLHHDAGRGQRLSNTQS